jgi:hypothetical protein
VTFLGVGTSATIWATMPALDDRWWWMWSSRWNENWQGKPKCSGKTCPSASLSTTNRAWPGLGSNPGRRCWKPATNGLSYGTASLVTLLFSVFINGLSNLINHFKFLSLLTIWESLESCNHPVIAFCFNPMLIPWVSGALLTPWNYIIVSCRDANVLCLYRICMNGHYARNWTVNYF